MIKKIIIIFFILSKICFLNCIEEKKIKNFKRAIKYGKYSKVKSMMEENSDLMLYISQSSIALTTCSSSGQLEIAKLLLKNGAITNATNNWLSPLYVSKDLDMVKLLVENGADINYRINDGITLINKFAGDGYYEISKYLFDNGVKMYYTDSDGRIYSATNRALSASDNSYLLNDPSFTLEQKERFLLENRNRKKFVEYVVENCENIDEYDPEKKGIYRSLQREYYELAENMLNQYSLNDSLVNRKILGAACRFNNINIVKTLITKGVPISYKPARIRPDMYPHPIPLAARNGNFEILEYLLLHRKISPNKEEKDRFFASDRELNLALNYSLLKKHTKCSILLLEDGASTGVLGRTLDNQGIYAMNIAIKKGDVQVVNYLIAHDVIVQERHIQMAKESNQKAIEYILKSRLVQNDQ